MGGRVAANAGTIAKLIDGRACETRFAAIRRTFHHNIEEWATLLDLWPETGRKHQLRIHCASLGHAIVGEEWYARGGMHCAAFERASPMWEGWHSNGLYLWAVELALTHPMTGERLRFKIDTPEKFEAGARVGREGRRRRRVYRGRAGLLRRAGGGLSLGFRVPPLAPSEQDSPVPAWLPAIGGAPVLAEGG